MSALSISWAGEGNTQCSCKYGILTCIAGMISSLMKRERELSENLRTPPESSLADITIGSRDWADILAW